jgi:hypothetical protein
VTAHISISCDGTLPSGMPCRGKLPTREFTFPAARHAARTKDWSTSAVEDLDWCPACTRRSPGW